MSIKGKLLLGLLILFLVFSGLKVFLEMSARNTFIFSEVITGRLNAAEEKSILSAVRVVSAPEDSGLFFSFFEKVRLNLSYHVLYSKADFWVSSLYADKRKSLAVAIFNIGGIKYSRIFEESIMLGGFRLMTKNLKGQQEEEFLDQESLEVELCQSPVLPNELQELISAELSLGQNIRLIPQELNELKDMILGNSEVNEINGINSLNISFKNLKSRPNYKNFLRKYLTRTELDGDLEASIYLSNDGLLEYTLLRNYENKVWISSIESRYGRINNSGVKVPVIKVQGGLPMPWLWIKDAKQNSANLEPHPKYVHYYNNWGQIKNRPEILEWYRINQLNSL
jgi:hypothetical protein